MRRTLLRALPALVALSLLAGPSGAQIFPGGGYGRGNPNTQDRDHGVNTTSKRKTVSGTVKSVDTQHKLMVVSGESGKTGKDVPVDVGPSLIKAGKGSAKFDDIKVGDKLKVFGEVTAQGGLRAMEITLPASRMTIPPTPKQKPAPKVKKTAEEKAREKAAKKEAKEKAAAEAKAAKAAAKEAKAAKADKPKRERKGKKGSEDKAEGKEKGSGAAEEQKN
jgi:hypothetical protein